MNSIETSGTFDESIAKSAAGAQVLARALRALIEEAYPEVTEVPWAIQGNIGYGVGPKKNTEHFCYIGAHAKHVNLGFNYGAELDDPDGLLEGTGKNFRHVKIKAAGDIDDALRALLERAVVERTAALA